MADSKTDEKFTGVIDFKLPTLGQSLALVGLSAILVTVGIFMLVPFTQLLESIGRKDDLTVSVDIAPPPPPPPPDPPEEEEEEMEDTPPPEPPPPPPPQLSLSQLDLAMDPGIGDAMEGAFGFGGFDTRPDAMAEMKEFFDVKELDEKLRVLNFQSPEKPYNMRRDRVEGFTRVTFIVDENGNVSRVLGFKETTHRELEEAVRKVINLWKFSSPTKDGRKVKARVEQPIRF